MSALAPYLGPFVLQTRPVEAVREANLDLYFAPGSESAPSVVFVHGGPIPESLAPKPRDWPLFRGYGAAAAERGLVGAVVEHRLHDDSSFTQASGDIAAGIEQLRAEPRVDADRIALWFFSGAGALMGTWLNQPPPWLCCVAASYPFIPTAEELGDRLVAPCDALSAVGDLPILLTRAGLERPEFACRVDDFVVAAQTVGANITLIDVPHGHHGFDVVDDSDASKTAVVDALDWVCARVSRHMR